MLRNIPCSPFPSEQPHSHFVLPLILTKKPLLARERKLPSLTNLTASSSNSSRGCTPKRPAFLLRGPSTVTLPYVSAKHWSVSTLSSHISGVKDQTQVEVASLTKIMTALVCTQLIDQYSLDWNLRISISETAAKTPGTSAQLKPCDSLTLQNLLYGLMLPSGNDAAVALAEYFGKLLNPETHSPREEFVGEMNRVAASLKLTNTVYQNPHGLSKKKNLLTAKDVNSLAVKALADSRIRQIVNTREYVCEIEGKKIRKVVWRNTNLMLTKDFNGVKTGVTAKAGPCLCVSKVLPTGDTIVVTVLASRSMDSRWSDVSKLARWALAKLQSST